MLVKTAIILTCSAALLLVSGALAYSADAITVEGSFGMQAEQVEILQARLKSTAGIADFAAVDLKAVSSVQLQVLAAENSIPRQIGMSRNVAQLSTADTAGKQLQWHKLPGQGQYAGLKISSPQARALRVGMTVDALPAGAELRFFSLINGQPGDIQLATASHVLQTLALNRDADPDDPNGRVFWSPTVSGETMGIEIYLPENTNPASVRIAFPLISHISILPFGSAVNAYTVQGYGDSDPCQNDATCAGAWANVSNSVAGMQFTTIDGTFICTGSLLNDKDTTTSIPYFISANHCISTQATASSLETHWFWQSAVCNGTTRSPKYQMIGGGADLLYTQGMSSGTPTSSSMDTSLMKLKRTPPSGAYYAGWSTAVPPGTGSSRTGIHHPMGDWKKISYGIADGEYACGNFDGSSFSCSPGTGNFYAVDWSDGGTESGSSGSALYTSTMALIGTLTGGNGSCADSFSVYSSFREAYIAGNYGQWLNSAPDPGSGKAVVAPANFLLLH